MTQPTGYFLEPDFAVELLTRKGSELPWCAFGTAWLDPEIDGLLIQTNFVPEQKTIILRLKPIYSA